MKAGNDRTVAGHNRAKTLTIGLARIIVGSTVAPEVAGSNPVIHPNSHPVSSSR